MTYQPLNFGSSAPDDGEPISSAFVKIDSNFADIFATMPVGVDRSAGYLPVNSIVITDNWTNMLAQATAHGVKPNATGALTIATNPSSSPQGYALAKLGIQGPQAAGWFTNPPANNFVVLYSVVDSDNTRSFIFAANFTAIVTPNNDAFANGLEIDINNDNSVVDNQSDFTNVKNGLKIASGGTASPSNGIAIDSVTSTASTFFMRGIRLTRAIVGLYLTQRGGESNDSFSSGAIIDDSNSSVGYKIAGGTHNYGIDLSGGNYSTAVFRGKGHYMFSGNTGALPAGPSGTIFQVAAADGVGGRILIDAFAGFPELDMRAAAGTAGSPSAVTTGTQLAGVSAFGYGATGYSAQARGRFFFKNAEAGNWTDAAQGTSFQINTTLIGTTTTAGRFVIDGNGNLQLGAGVSIPATNGWPYLPTTAGAPAGVPTSISGFGPIQGDTTNNSLWSYLSSAWQQFLPASMLLFVGGFAHSVNFNSANTDTSIAITLPAGVTRYRLNAVVISGASASLSTATFGVFTASGGGGVALVAAGTAIGVTAATENTANNMQSTAGSAIISTTATTLFFRVGTAEGSAATGNVHLYIQPLP